MSYCFVHAPRAELTQLLASVSPDPLSYRVFLLSTGSEAVEQRGGKFMSMCIFMNWRVVLQFPQIAARTPSMRFDVTWGYRVLRQEFPFLSRLSDKPRFLELLSVVRSGSRGTSRRRNASLMNQDQVRRVGPAVEEIAISASETDREAPRG